MEKSKDSLLMKIIEDKNYHEAHAGTRRPSVESELSMDSVRNWNPSAAIHTPL